MTKRRRDIGNRILKTPEFIDKTQLFRLPPGVNTPIGRLTHLADRKVPALHHCFNELLIDIVDKGLKNLALLGAQGPHRGTAILERSAGDNDRFDTDLAQELLSIGQLDDYTNAAGHGTGMGKDTIRRTGNVIASRRSNAAQGGDHELAP